MKLPDRKTRRLLAKRTLLVADKASELQETLRRLTYELLNEHDAPGLKGTVDALLTWLRAEAAELSERSRTLEDSLRQAVDP